MGVYHGDKKANEAHSMNLYFTLASYAVAASIGGAAVGVWKNGQIADIKLEVADADMARKKESFRSLELDSQKKSGAAAEKIRRDAGLRAAADRAVNAGHGLRIASADTVRASQESAAACLASVALYDAILNTVVEAGGRIAREADQWESDAIAQHEAAK